MKYNTDTMHKPLFPLTTNLLQMLLTALIIWPLAGAAQLLEDATGWDEETAINHSQARVGQPLGEYRFTRRDGGTATLSEFAGKPMLISMIFTSCHHVCPTTTKRLDDAVRAAKDVLGPDAFNVVTVGFDTVNDTPEAMKAFARQQSVRDENWAFLSADFETVNALATDLGFIYYRSPRGFDHITQVSVIDKTGQVYRQVYGVQFELPWLVEPLKELVFDRPATLRNPFANLVGRIRLFCTVYDPARDRYHFDFSLFIQMAIGFLSIVGIGWFLVREMRRSRTS
jgi:protein SCO1/2